MTDAELIAQIEDFAGSSDANRETRILDSILAHFACATGTIHRLDGETDLLHLVAQRGIPDAILERVARIPVGKGMAGLAAERREAVQVCNLQTDNSGDANPGAKMTEMRGSIAVPMIVDGVVCGTLGIARPDEYEFSVDQIETLKQIGEMIGRRFGSG